MLKIEYNNRFKKDYKLIKKRGYDTRKLEEVLNILITLRPLPPKYKEHTLTGNWSGFRECHIMPDWLLIYKIEEDTLILTPTRTETHSDLF